MTRTVDAIGTILVPLDQTPAAEAALPTATELAARLGDSIELVTVSSPGIEPFPDELYLKEIADTLSVSTRTRVVHDNDVAPALLRVAAEDGAEAICLGVRGIGDLATRVLGSVADDLVGNGSLPVVAVGPGVSTPPRPLDVVTVCLDGTPAADAVVDPAAVLATRLGARVELLVVTSTLGSWDATDYVNSTAAALRDACGGDVAGFVSTVMLTVPGPMAMVISAHASARGSGLLALSSQPSSRRGVVHRSVIHHLLHRSTCPVLLAR